LHRPPQTWQQLQDYSQKLTLDTNNDHRKDRYGLGITPELARQYFLIKAFGGNLIDRNGYANFATKESERGLQKIIEQYQLSQGFAHATIWQAGIHLPIIRMHFNNQFLSAFLGQQSLKSALQKAQADANQEIKAADY
jgi:ABC-type glycerol-3-phosphate transport system substrate-binding protein